MYDKGEREEAIQEYRTAIALDPKFAQAHNNLGLAMYDKGEREEAIQEYRTAIRLDPKDAKAHVNLGNALYVKGDLEEAIQEFRTAIRLDPKDAKAHSNLGSALAAKGEREEAIQEFRTTIALDPKFAQAHNNLGLAMYDKGEREEAIQEYRTAIRLDPKNAQAHYNLGNALAAKGDLDGAIACYRKALDLNPKYAEAHCNLGHILRRQGHFDKAMACLRRGHELGSKRPGWPYPSAQWLRHAERLAVLDRKLPAVLQGEASPANASEAVTLASMCQQYKKQSVAAVRLYAEAFAAEPKLANDLQAAHRYNAACSAALAASGKGEGAGKLDDTERVRLRQQARGWLRADLDLWAKQVENGKPPVRAAARQTLQRWQKDPDLASLRDAAALAKLPEAERADFEKLWADVAALLKKCAGTDKP
jgi:tetratricopeptide (TPR) repeat protein